MGGRWTGNLLPRRDRKGVRLLATDSWQAFHKVTAPSPPPPGTLFGGMKTVLGERTSRTSCFIRRNRVASQRGRSRKDKSRYRKSRRMTESKKAPLPLARRSGAL